MMVRLAVDGMSALRLLPATPQPSSTSGTFEKASSDPGVVPTTESTPDPVQTVQEDIKTGRGRRGRKRTQNAEEAK